ncbi:uncharacterized protein LOC125052165 [Pieris napi]|uniref:uncharacterized protein LOC125052165 n=1 Tax=Pieris napi TaxID=78633 RepID=UPI001FB8FF76|nr:uncharacterized protein LOC125052165 [Pieris napi]
MDLIKSAREFISHWYLRYILSIELYMVEPWERLVIHVIFAIFFGLFWYFNYSVIVYAIAHIRDCPSHAYEML